MRNIGKTSTPFFKSVRPRARQRPWLWPFFVVCWLSACNSPPPPPDIIQEIELSGPVVTGHAQLSGLAWFGDWLILLPQFPDFSGDGSFVYGLPKSAIVDYLAQPAQPLTPIPIHFDTGNLDILGSQGFEAIDFRGETAVFTIEAAPWGLMRGYLLRGTMTADASQLSLDIDTITEILPQARQFNMAYESILAIDGGFLAFYELNGKRFNANPHAILFDDGLQAIKTAVMPNIPYRITDVTSVDENGRFWAINYWPRGLNMLTPQPAWFHTQPSIEQLIELQYTASGAIIQTKTPPLNLFGQEGRNWEGIVRLEDQGFLLVTDNSPRTILAFVPATGRQTTP